MPETPDEARRAARALNQSPEVGDFVIERPETCPECGSPLRWNKYGARWDCSNYGACENAGG